jgi:hypothetical protein
MTNLYIFLVKFIPTFTLVTSVLWLIVAIKIYKIIHRKFVLTFIVAEVMYIFYMLLEIIQSLGIGHFSLFMYSSFLYTLGMLLNLIGLLLCLKYLHQIIPATNQNPTINNMS